MKILFIVSAYWPSVGGMETVHEYQAEMLKKFGHDVRVICLGGTEYGEYNHNGVPVTRIPAQKRIINSYVDTEKLINVVDGFTPEICLYSPVTSYTASRVLPVLSKIKCKKIGMLHGFSTEGNIKLMSLKQKMISLLKFIRDRVRLAICWKYILQLDAVTHLHKSDSTYDFFIKHGYKNNMILYNAVDDSFFINADDKNIAQKENIIINVGNYKAVKNQLKLVELFYQCNLDNWQLILIGGVENDYYLQVQHKIHELEKENGFKDIKLLVGINREDTINYVKRAKIYVSTSTIEAFPVSIIEGMASGLGVVATDVGVVKDIVEEANAGLICSYDDMSEKLFAMTKFWNDYGQSGYQWAAKNCNKYLQVKKLENIIYSLIE